MSTFKKKMILHFCVGKKLTLEKDNICDVENGQALFGCIHL